MAGLLVSALQADFSARVTCLSFNPYLRHFQPERRRIRPADIAPPLEGSFIRLLILHSATRRNKENGPQERSDTFGPSGKERRLERFAAKKRQRYRSSYKCEPGPRETDSDEVSKGLADR